MASKRAIFKQTLILLPVYVNVIMMGAAVGWIANALFLLRQPATGIPITFTQGSWIAASTQIGKLLFAIPAGILADKIGRKKICTTVAVMNFVCWLTLTINQSIIAIFLVRFVLGITMALLHSVALMLIGEIASPEIRGLYVGMYQVCSYTGILFESIIAVIFSSYKILAYATALLSISYFAICWWLEESPSQLLNKSKDAEALRVLRHIRPNYTEDELVQEFETMKRCINSENELRTNFSFARFIYSPINRNSLLLLIALNFFSSFTGSASLSSYITLILPKNKYFGKKFYPLIAVILNILAAICGSFLLDKLPRKALYLSITASVFLLHSFNGLTSLLRINDDSWSIPFIVGNFIFLLIWSSVFEPTNDLVKSEILPQNIKGLGSSLCVMSLAASKALSYMLFETVSVSLGIHWNYWIFAINALVTAAIVYFTLPEGRGKSLAEIQNNMRNDNFQDHR